MSKKAHSTFDSSRPRWNEQYQVTLDTLQGDHLKEALQYSFRGIFKYLETLLFEGNTKLALQNVRTLQRFVFPSSPKLSSLKKLILSRADYFELYPDEQKEVVRLLFSGKVPLSTNWKKVKGRMASGNAVTLLIPNPGHRFEQPVWGKVWGICADTEFVISSIVENTAKNIALPIKLDLSQLVRVKGGMFQTSVQGCYSTQELHAIFHHIYDQQGDKLQLNFPISDAILPHWHIQA